MPVPGGITLHAMRPTTLAARLALGAFLGAAAAVAHAQTATTLPVVRVKADAEGALPAAQPGGQTARGGRLGMLGNTDTMKAPFSTSSFTAKAVADQQAVTAADIVTADSSVRFTGQTGGMFDTFFIRGFPIGEGNVGEVAFDGFYGIAPNYRILTEYAERIELLKGPGALLYGMSPNSGIGGVINIVPKRAGAQDKTSFTADYASKGQVGGHLDLGRRFGADRQWGLRVNASHRDGDTAVDHQSRRADVGAVALDYTGERLRATLDLIEQKEQIDAPLRPFMLAAGVAVPAAPDSRRNVTQSWEYADVEDRSALLRGEYELGKQSVLFGGVGKSRTKVDRLFSLHTITNAAGATSSLPQHFQFDIERSTAELGLRQRFATGVVRHTLTLQASTYGDSLSRGSVNGSAITSNIYAPVTRPAQSVAAPTSVPRISDADLSGWAVADTMAFHDDAVLLTLGLRDQRVQSRNFSAATGAATTAYDKRALSPMAGLVVRPWEQVSLYANHIQGLSKGDITPDGTALAPYKARQTEVGVKLEHGGLIGTLGLFQIHKPAGVITAGVFSATEQRNRGIELNVTGQAATGVRVIGGLTLLDAELTNSNSATTVGKRPVGVPTRQANLGAEWDLAGLQGATLTGAITHTGKQYVDATNTRQLPSWTKVDLGARYVTRIAGQATTLRANLLNAFGRDYWSGVTSWAGIAQGAPRTLRVSATVDF